jgi:hypothetical protein
LQGIQHPIHINAVNLKNVSVIDQEELSPEYFVFQFALQKYDYSILKYNFVFGFVWV